MHGDTERMSESDNKLFAADALDILKTESLQLYKKHCYEMIGRKYPFMNLKEIFKKQGGMKLLGQYWKGGALFYRSRRIFPVRKE